MASLDCGLKYVTCFLRAKTKLLSLTWKATSQTCSCVNHTCVSLHIKPIYKAMLVGCDCARFLRNRHRIRHQMREVGEISFSSARGKTPHPQPHYWYNFDVPMKTLELSLLCCRLIKSTLVFWVVGCILWIAKRSPVQSSLYFNHLPQKGGVRGEVLVFWTKRMLCKFKFPHR